ncbi:MAG: 1-phosphofructokinase [Oscillibacter sp.]|nr:1-phosphofructokinase [Oscillibacter sp.]
MVYTVTFNPALDYVLHMDHFQTGGLNRTQSEEIHCGGKGVNVSTVLKNLGVENVALGFLAGFTGQALESGLQKAGIRSDFIWLQTGMTRVNVKIKSGLETEINNPGPAIPPQALEGLFQKLDQLRPGDIIVLAGSIPDPHPEEIYRRLFTRLEGRGVLAVVDAAGKLLRTVLPFHPFLIKPNLQELGDLFGERLESKNRTEILNRAKQLQAWGAQNVLVSMAGDGSLLLDGDGGSHWLGVPPGTVRNSVGAGDSMVAGFLAGWLRDGSYNTAHRMGAAAGSATAFSNGLASKTEILALLDAF